MNSCKVGSDHFSDYVGVCVCGGGTCDGRQASEPLQKTRIKSETFWDHILSLECDEQTHKIYRAHVWFGKINISKAIIY